MRLCIPVVLVCSLVLSSHCVLPAFAACVVSVCLWCVLKLHFHWSTTFGTIHLNPNVTLVTAPKRQMCCCFQRWGSTLKCRQGWYWLPSVYCFHFSLDWHTVTYALHYCPTDDTIRLLTFSSWALLAIIVTVLPLAPARPLTHYAPSLSPLSLLLHHTQHTSEVACYKDTSFSWKGCRKWHPSSEHRGWDDAVRTNQLVVCSVLTPLSVRSQRWLPQQEGDV